MDEGEFARAPGKEKAKGKAKAKPKGTGKVKAKASGEGRKRKQQLSRGGIPPGGRGFVCPADGCDHVEDTAAEVLAHAASQCGGEGRTRDDDGKSACLWDGCGKLVNVGKMNKRKWAPWGSLGGLRRHEALHEKGGPPRGFVCPSSDCEQNYPTSEEAWAHAEEAHEIESNEKMCLWDGCGYVAIKRQHYRWHEPTHTGKWPAFCPASGCGKGFRKDGARTLYHPPAPSGPPCFLLHPRAPTSHGPQSPASCCRVGRHLLRHNGCLQLRLGDEGP